MERVLEREVLLSLYVSRRSDRRFQAEQEGKFILTARASCRDRNWGVWQTPRGRGFSPTWFSPWLRAIQMVDVFGAGMVVHFSSKDLGQSAGI